MKAALYYGPGDVRVEQVPEPVIGDGQLKIKVAWNGICGSDLHSYFVPLPGHPTLTTPSHVTGEKLPIVMGHEFSGTVVEVGSGVDANKFPIGQNIVVEPVLSCMETTCGPCTNGTRNVCPHMTFIGIGGWGGGLSEYVAVNQEYVHILPAGVPLDVGAMMEPLSIVWHAAKRANFQPGSSALIIGAGPIGLLLLKVLQAHGASWVGVSEPALQRRNQAQRFAATAVFDPLATDVIAEVRKATNGHGADVVFDCAGIQVSLNTAIAAVRARGTVVNVAVWEKLPTINLNDMGGKEIILTSTNGADRVHSELLSAVATGKLTGLEELITKKIALEEIVEGGIKCLLAEKDTQIKILVHP